MKSGYLLLGIVCLTWSSSVSAQESLDVHAKLVLADKKSIYRIGKPIRLVLELTADRDGYTADTIPDGTNPISDSIFVSPDSGVSHWLDELLSGGRGFRDYFTQVNLSNTPTTVEILLNDSIRIDRAGRYSVKVTTRRVSFRSGSPEYKPPLTLTTNEVTFEVQSMSDADEESEVKRVSELIDAAHGWQAEEQAARELAYLTGDVSAREKVRRFLTSDGRSGNYYGQIYNGLFISRNRPLVLQQLEAAMRDPETSVTSGLLGSVTKLRLLRERAGIALKPTTAMSPHNPNADPRLAEIQDTYVTELAAGLLKRTGKSQTTTAMTILMHLPKDAQAKSALLGEVRRLLLQQFDSLHPFDQEYLLRQYWDQLRDPSLLPSIKQMLSSKGLASKNVHDTALKRLIEIAPEEARSFVVSEIIDPTSMVDYEILRSLSDASLPETDASLLEQLRRFSSSTRSYEVTYLKQKASLAARYATVGIYQELMELYQQNGAKWPLEVRACLLAYFARHNENEALPLIEQVLAGIEPGQDFNFLPDLTRLYYSNGIDGVLRKRLESDEPRAVSTSAWLMSKYGPAGDQQVIETRLERWRKDWGIRAAEAQTNLQGTAEREMVMALLSAKSWKASPERAKEFEQSCITELCRQNFRH